MENLQKYSQIVFFTRNPHYSHHLALAERMSANFPKEKMIFATFFSKAAAAVEKAGYKVFYIPGELRKYKSVNPDPEVIRRVEKEISTFDSKLSLDIMLASERFLPKRKSEHKQFCWQHIAVLDQLIKPGTLAMSSMFDHFVYWLAGTLTNSRKGAYFAFNACGVPAGSMALRTPWEAWEGPISRDANACWEDTKVKLFEPVEKRIDYMGPMLKRPLLRDNLRLYFRNVFKYDRKDGRMGSYFSYYPNLYGFVKGWFVAKYRQKAYHEPEYDIHSLSDLRKLGESKCIFVALHMEPEATILMYSPWFQDQYELCSEIRACLPKEVPIVIKENPKMRGKRPLDYYHRLRDLGNVHLVAPTVPAVPLMQESKAVVSLAGNACLEAVFMSIPSIVIGCPPFRHILSDSDFSGEKGLDKSRLSARLNDPKCATPENVSVEWAKWVRGTLDAESLPIWQGEERHINSTPENLDKFIDYMDFCSAKVFE